MIADVDTPLAPGVYAGARDAVQGFAKYINQQGGFAGRKVVVDFYDSKLTGDETRNAIIKACQNDFAVVGTGALFLNNVDDMVACPDKAGAKTGPARRPGGHHLGTAAELAGVVPDHRAVEGVQRPDG